MKTDVIQLTKQLIEIASYVREDINEVNIANYIFSFLKRNGLSPYKQFIDQKRFNVIVVKGNPKLWLCAHMDTVEQKTNEDLNPKRIGNKLYGLGATDMKSGIAAILCAVSNAKQLNNIGLLFYCDEEYNFAGMKKFLENFDGKPELVIIPESTNMQISNAHRGLIELNAVIKGKTGHASRPEEGINAIAQTVKAVEEMAKKLSLKYSNSNVGITTCTLSRIKGGLQVGVKDNNIIYAKGTNSIPDTAEVWLDIRPAVKNFRGKKAIDIFKKHIEKNACILENVAITEDLGSLFTPTSQLTRFEKILEKTLGKKEYLPGKKMGYGDGQLFFEKTDSPVIYFGAGPSETCHKKGEYVLIDQVKMLEKILKEVIKEYEK